ncbi:MAG TPA: SDR family NAD(P)-dependent oxidoreductase [Gemmatimonadales bacterium]|nr:SDR family NAD(P)-dependent oxidoreductase [Gemmatimonadales bacterium]
MPPPIALVTGATLGIGRATAFALGRAGYRVGVCARTGSAIDALLEALRAEGIEAAGSAADVSDPAQVQALVAQVAGSLGPIDVLINNAGIARLAPFSELTLEDWDATMATNLRSLYLVTREVLPGMRTRKSGFIINVASLAAKYAFAGGTAYVASKHAVLGFSRTLMLEVRKDGVRVVTICPGSVDTPLMREQGVLKPNAESILKPDDVAQAILDALRMPARALVSELDLRPANP